MHKNCPTTSKQLAECNYIIMKMLIHVRKASECLSSTGQESVFFSAELFARRCDGFVFFLRGAFFRLGLSFNFEVEVSIVSHGIRAPDSPCRRFALGLLDIETDEDAEQG